MGREPFHLRCLAAACGCTPGGDCLCPVLTAYARRCAQEGALLSWRDQTLCRESAQPASPIPRLFPPAPSRNGSVGSNGFAAREGPQKDL